MLVVAIAVMIWGLGRAFRWPGTVVWALIGLLWVTVFAMQLVLPERHGLRLATGESPVLWGLVGAGVLAVALYARGLKWLKARAQVPQVVSAAKPGAFSDV